MDCRWAVNPLLWYAEIIGIKAGEVHLVLLIGRFNPGTYTIRVCGWMANSQAQHTIGDTLLVEA